VLNPENLPPVEKLHSQQKVIIFDDIKLDNMKKLMEYFSLFRNKNYNCIYFQSWALYLPMLKRNATSTT